MAKDTQAACTPGAGDAHWKAPREISATRCALARASGARWGLQEILGIRCALARACGAQGSAARVQGCCG